MPVSGLPHLLEHTCFLLERSPGVIPRATCLLQPGPCLQTVTLESPGESQHPPAPTYAVSLASPMLLPQALDAAGLCPWLVSAPPGMGAPGGRRTCLVPCWAPQPLACGRCPCKAFGTSLSSGQGDGCRMVGSTQGSQEGQSFLWFCEKQHFQEPLQGSKKR